jgi:hypothetical protein
MTLSKRLQRLEQRLTPGPTQRPRQSVIVETFADGRHVDGLTGQPYTAADLAALRTEGVMLVLVELPAAR